MKNVSSQRTVNDVNVVVRFLMGQKAEARRRKEPEVYNEFWVFASGGACMSNYTMMGGLGRVPNDVMRKALDRVPMFA